MNIKNRLKKVFFYFILIAIPLICIELGMRIFMAVWLAPDLFFFGTGLVRTEIQRQIDPLGYETRDEYKFKKIRREADKADVTGQRLDCANYSKYSPGETRVDFDEKGEKFVIKMNNKGFRGPDIFDKKDPGTVRIITLGGSSTFGYHDRDDETYPYYLQEILNNYLKEHKIDKIKNFEVINLGIPTLRAENIYSLFINEALPLRPNIVTFYEGINNVSSEQDIRDFNKKYKQNKYYKNILKTWREIRQRSLLFAFSANFVNNVFVKYNIADLTEDNQIFKDTMPGKSMELPVFFEAVSSNMSKRQEAMTASFLNHLDMINRGCKDHHTFFLVANQQAASCTFPHEKLKGKTYQDELFYVVNKIKNNDNITLHQLYLLKHAILMNAIRSWALKENVAFVDIINALNQDRDTLLSNVHLNPRGNKIIAKEFADKIFNHVLGNSN
jgi:lysophospholipase L1-like esterase